jgi:hypothetical protein
MRDAEERTWEIVRRAYEERSPMPRRRSTNRLVITLAVVAIGVAAAAIASPPGQAVFRKMREVVGVQHAEPALFSLPSPGRLLVVSARHGGVWLVHSNGLKRRIGSYDAQWSPHGLFVVATTQEPPLRRRGRQRALELLARRASGAAALGRNAHDTRTPTSPRAACVLSQATGPATTSSTHAQTPPAWGSHARAQYARLRLGRAVAEEHRHRTHRSHTCPDRPDRVERRKFWRCARRSASSY